MFAVIAEAPLGSTMACSVHDTEDGAKTERDRQVNSRDGSWYFYVAKVAEDEY